MTVLIAWVRTIQDCEELIFVSDSRLNDWRNFDTCPKVLTLPRNDCAIAFSGDTKDAYPMMLQLGLAIDAHEPLRVGSLDVSSLKSHALKIFDSMAHLIEHSDHVVGEVEADPTTFLFGGYSWVNKQFELWSIAYRQSENKFVARPAQWACYSEEAKKVVFRSMKSPQAGEIASKIAFAGDQGKAARELLTAKLAKVHPTSMTYRGLGWEPFEVVRDMLRDPNHSYTIGGAPQVLKVYQYMRTAPLGVYWPDKKSGTIYLQGRPALGYERMDRWVLDPDTMHSESPKHSRNDADDATQESLP